MELQKQPSRWSCLPTSLAMCLGIPVTEIFDLLQHDGSEILWPDLPEPYRRRGFSYHEMVYVAGMYKHALIGHEPKWYNTPDGQRFHYFDPPRGVWDALLLDNWGIISGKSKDLGRPHAVAWDGRNIYDPNGTIYQVHNNFNVEQFLACCRLQR